MTAHLVRHGEILREGDTIRLTATGDNWTVNDIIPPYSEGDVGAVIATAPWDEQHRFKPNAFGAYIDERAPITDNEPPF